MRSLFLSRLDHTEPARLIQVRAGPGSPLPTPPIVIASLLGRGHTLLYRFLDLPGTRALAKGRGAGRNLTHMLFLLGQCLLPRDRIFALLPLVDLVCAWRPVKVVQAVLANKDGFLDDVLEKVLIVRGHDEGSIRRDEVALEPERSVQVLCHTACERVSAVSACRNAPKSCSARPRATRPTLPAATSREGIASAIRRRAT